MAYLKSGCKISILAAKHDTKNDRTTNVCIIQEDQLLIKTHHIMPIKKVSMPYTLRINWNQLKVRKENKWPTIT